MAGPSPIEFAELLGLTQGIDAPPAKALSPRVLKRAVDMISPVLSVPLTQSMMFYNQLAALYLPSLLRTFFSEACDPNQNEAGWSLYFAAIAGVMQTDSFQRFLRDHTEEGSSFFAVIIKWIGEFSTYHRTDVDVAPNLLLRILTTFESLLIRMVRIVSVRPLIPPVDQVIRDKVLVLLPWMKRLEIYEPDMLNSLEDVATQTLNDRIPEVQAAFQDADLPVAWEYCNLRCSRTELDGREQGCEDGKVMDECGRCFDVRYCSTEHQRLDWKRHKPSCFKPSW